MDYLVMFRGLELTDEEKRVELDQRKAFRVMVQEAIEKAEHAQDDQTNSLAAGE